MTTIVEAGNYPPVNRGELRDRMPAASAGPQGAQRAAVGRDRESAGQQQPTSVQKDHERRRCLRMAVEIVPGLGAVERVIPEGS